MQPQLRTRAPKARTQIFVLSPGVQTRNSIRVHKPAAAPPVKHGVEPICAVLPIAPATYYEHLAKRADPARQSDRALGDAELRPHIQRVFDANWHINRR